MMEYTDNWYPFKRIVKYDNHSLFVGYYIFDKPIYVNTRYEDEIKIDDYKLGSVELLRLIFSISVILLTSILTIATYINTNSIWLTLLMGLFSIVMYCSGMCVIGSYIRSVKYPYRLRYGSTQIYIDESLKNMC